MSSKYQVVIRNSQLNELDTVAVLQGAGNKGQAVRIKAVAGQRYQLVDTAKAEGMAPDWVRVKRSGKNLLVFFEDSFEADLVIEDYYEVMPEGYNAVIGQAEVGGLYEYFPEDPDTYGLVPNLVDGSALSTNVVLGGAEIAGFELAGLPLIAAFPWGLAAAGAAGAAALAGGGGESGGGGGSGGGGSGGGEIDPNDPANKLKVFVLDGQNDTDAGLGTVYVNAAEFNGNGDEGATKPGVQLGLKLPEGAVAGSVITLTLTPLAGGPNIVVPPYIVTAADVATGSFGLDLSPELFGGVAPMQGDYTVQASMLAPGADSAAAVLSNVAPFTIDTVIELPVVDFDLDGVPQNVMFIIPSVGSEGPTGSGLTKATISWVEDNNTAQGQPRSMELTRQLGEDGKPTGNWLLPEGANLPPGAYFDSVAGVLTFDAKLLLENSAATVRVWDAAGNTSTGDLKPSDWDDWRRTQLDLTLQIDEASDGWVNQAEAADGIQTKVMLPKGALVGDQVQVELQRVNADGNPEGVKLLSAMRPLTADDLARGYVEITVNNGTGTSQKWTDGSYQSVARLYDSKGVELEDSNQVDFEMDTTPPKVDFKLDSITGDDFVAGAEKTSTSLTLTGFATGEFKEGDTVTITLQKDANTSITYKAQLDANGKAVFTDVSGAALVTDADDAVAFELSTQDAAGNSTIITGSRSYAVEGGGAPLDRHGEAANEGVWTAIRINPITDDNIITQAEINDAKLVDGAKLIPIAGQVTGKFATGDVVHLHLNNKVYTYTLKADGKFEVDVLATDLQNDVDSRIDAVVTGTGGDTATANQSYQFVAAPIDPNNQAPDPAPAPIDPGHAGATALFIDPITDDNILNKVESEGNVTVTGRVTGAFAEEDKVTLSLHLKDGSTVEYIAVVDIEGKFKAIVKGEDLANDTDTTINAKLSRADGSAVYATQNYGVITDSPTYAELDLVIRIATDFENALGHELEEGDGWVNAKEINAQAVKNPELANKLLSLIEFDPEMMVVGDKLIVTATNTGPNNPPLAQTQIFVLTQELIEAGKIKVVFDKPGQDNTQTVTVVHTDAYGNEAEGHPPTDVATEDTEAGNISLKVQRADGTSSDTTIDAVDFEAARGVEVKIALPSDEQMREGDVIKVQLFAGSTSRAEVLHELTANNVVDGFAIVLFDPDPFLRVGHTSIDKPGYEVRIGNYSVEAELLDKAGNISEKDNKQNFVLTQRDAITLGDQNFAGETQTKNLYIKGSDFSNIIIAGFGNDWIYGGSGNNTLSGGAGSDVFIYNQDSLGARDTITDFEFGNAGDKLYLRDLLKNFTADSDKSLFFKITSTTGDDNGKVVLKIDHDGTGFGEGSGDKVTINFANLPYDASSQALIERMMEDGNIVF